MLLQSKANPNEPVKNSEVVNTHGHFHSVTYSRTALVEFAEHSNIVVTFSNAPDADSVNQRKNYAHLAQCLVDASDVNLQDSRGATALMIAAKNNNRYLIVRLIKKGARINTIKDKKGRTAVDYAMEAGQTDLAKILMGFKI